MTYQANGRKRKGKSVSKITEMVVLT